MGKPTIDYEISEWGTYGLGLNDLSSFPKNPLHKGNVVTVSLSRICRIGARGNIEAAILN